jgi:hypothetical protein
MTTTRRTYTFSNAGDIPHRPTRPPRNFEISRSVHLTSRLTFGAVLEDVLDNGIRPEVRFAPDSPLEGSGFELSVPLHSVCIGSPVGPETNRWSNTIFSDPGSPCTYPL